MGTRTRAPPKPEDNAAREGRPTADLDFALALALLDFDILAQSRGRSSLQSIVHTLRSQIIQGNLPKVVDKVFNLVTGSLERKNRQGRCDGTRSNRWHG